MKNYFDFTQSLRVFFNISNEIFSVDLDHQNVEVEDVEIKYFVNQPIYNNEIFNSYSYKFNKKENWVSLRLNYYSHYMARIIQFIKEYHGETITEDESKQIDAVLRIGNGEFTISNDNGALNYLVFSCDNNNGCFIDIAKENE